MQVSHCLFHSIWDFPSYDNWFSLKYRHFEHTKSQIMIKSFMFADDVFGLL